MEMGATGSLETIRDTRLRARILAYYRVAENQGADARWAAGHYQRLESALIAQGMAIADQMPLPELRERTQTAQLQAELRHARARTLTMFIFLESVAAARRELAEALEAASS